MAVSIREQDEIFSLIGRTLKKRAECYVLGGTAMLFLGLKETTKDIDVAFKDIEDYENFRKALIFLGAKETAAKIEKKEKISSILTLGEARFDLFLEHIISFKLSESVISRARESHEFANLIVNIISPEDIILFKSVADREGDRVDASNILKKTNVNWSIILDEAEKQTKNSEYFFVVFLYSFLNGIKEDFKVEIPKDFLKKLEKLTKEALAEAEKKLKKS